MKSRHIVVMAVVLCTVMLMVNMSGCRQNDNSKAIYGEWVFCGIAEAGAEYCEESIIMGEELMNDYGMNEIPEITIEINENGVKGLFENVPGTEIGDAEWVNDQQLRQPITITTMDGQTLDEPLLQDVSYTMKDGYLFVETNILNNPVDDPYDSGDINVYKRRD